MGTHIISRELCNKNNYLCDFVAGLEGETSNALFMILEEWNAQLKHANVEHLLEAGDSFEDVPEEPGPELGGPSL